MKYRLFLLLGGLVFGPGLTIAWLWPRQIPRSLGQIPVVPLLGLVVMCALAWLLFIRMLIYRRTITFQFDLGEIIFVSHDLLGSRRRSESMDQVIGVEVSQITRLRSSDTSDSSANCIVCYYATMTMADGKELRLFETTNAGRVREVLAALERHLGDRWVIAGREQLS